MSAVARSGSGRLAHQGRHRKSDSTGTAVRTAALSAGVAAAVVAGTAAPAQAADDPWRKLRQCESGDNYKINTGNGYYGAYQFDAGTWRAYGGSGLPHQNSPAEQDHRARLLYQDRGWAPWPACSRKLGLREDPSYGLTAKPTKPRPKRPAHPVTIAGPNTVKLKATYRITGRSRPSSKVIVRVREAGDRSWVAYPRKVDRKGRWSLPWSGGTDYQYQVVGEKTSAVRGTRVATTAAASAPTTSRLAAGDRPIVSVSGTARPDSKMILFVKASNGKWKTWKKFSTGRSGRWTLKLAAPSGTFHFYAKSANGLRSPVRALST